MQWWKTTFSISTFNDKNPSGEIYGQLRFAFGVGVLVLRRGVIREETIFGKT